MSIPRVKPANWGIGEKLTSAQQNELDTNVTYALDKRTGQTDTLSSVVTLAATGRIIQSVSPGPNADTTFQIDTQVLGVRIGTPNVLSAQRNYTLSNTNASNGDEISFFFDPDALGSFNVLIKDNGGSTLATLGPSGQAHWGEFKFISGAWKLKRLGGAPKLTSELFTSNGTWTCPAGVTEVLLQGVGGGGGGGGAAGSATGGENGIGGSGGGGALFGTARVAVTPGTSYAVTIGTGGSGGAAGAAGSNHGSNGNDGGDTVFGSTLATFYGAQGGHGGSYYGYGGADVYPIGGGPVRATLRPDRVNSTSIHTKGPPREGQGGCGDSSGVGTDAALQDGGGSAVSLGGARGAANGGGGGGASGWAGCVPGPGGTNGVAGTAGTLGAGGGGGGGILGGAGTAGGAGGNGALRITYVK